MYWPQLFTHLRYGIIVGGGRKYLSPWLEAWSCDLFETSMKRSTDMKQGGVSCVLVTVSFSSQGEHATCPCRSRDAWNRANPVNQRTNTWTRPRCTIFWAKERLILVYHWYFLIVMHHYYGNGSLMEMFKWDSFELWLWLTKEKWVFWLIQNGIILPTAEVNVVNSSFNLAWFYCF